MKQPYYYETQEAAFAPGIADGWPEVIPAPHAKKTGRLVRREGSRAILDVLDERRRQRHDEGWTDEHDDEHEEGALAQAGACYALHGTKGFGSYIRMICDGHVRGASHKGTAPRWWPWNFDWWKPKDRRRDLVRAAALLIAEIERLDRLELRQAFKTHKDRSV